MSPVHDFSGTEQTHICNSAKAFSSFIVGISINTCFLRKAIFIATLVDYMWHQNQSGAFLNQRDALRECRPPPRINTPHPPVRRPANLTTAQSLCYNHDGLIIAWDAWFFKATTTNKNSYLNFKQQQAQIQWQAFTAIYWCFSLGKIHTTV